MLAFRANVYILFTYYYVNRHISLSLLKCMFPLKLMKIYTPSDTRTLPEIINSAGSLSVRSI